MYTCLHTFNSNMVHVCAIFCVYMCTCTCIYSYLQWRCGPVVLWPQFRFGVDGWVGVCVCVCVCVCVRLFVYNGIFNQASCPVLYTAMLYDYVT